ncbi:DEAD/DEAH box helicase, partial [Rhodoferax sp. UBA5149]|uniref:DEAD/DEAH box helicase n=1 Tax=Rhodoferax sp. UBA5149 TaxID=1947379 RepID=UPI0025CCA9D9
MTDLNSDLTPDLIPDALPMAFAQLQLAEPLARAVADLGYESMTPIQAQAIPMVL